MVNKSLAVLIPYYNEQSLLSECLKSLFGSREKPDEVIVYDDASKEPAEEYIPPELPVQVIRGIINRGPAHGRNLLLKASQSDYIHFHDADDLFDACWCESVTNVIRKSAPDAVFTEISSYRDGQLECERVLGLKLLMDDEDLVRFCIRCAILPCGGTYRRESILAIGGYREQLWQSEDYDFHIRLAASGVCYEVVDRPLVRLRIREASRSRNEVEVWTSALEAVRLLAAELNTKYRPDLAERAACAGSILFRLGARSEARLAFRTARELGPPTYNQRRLLYGFVARAFGPETAELCGSFYRNVVCETGRRFLAQRGL